MQFLPMAACVCLFLALCQLLALAGALRGGELLVLAKQLCHAARGAAQALCSRTQPTTRQNVRLMPCFSDEHSRPGFICPLRAVRACCVEMAAFGQMPWGLLSCGGPPEGSIMLAMMQMNCSWPPGSRVCATVYWTLGLAGYLWQAARASHQLPVHSHL